jgi:tetraacyldisaccharide 4'-kinase
MAIQESGAEVLVLDDGFQHLALGRDIDFVLLDSSMPFGNRQLIPAGPLREPIEHLGRADAFVLTRTEDASRAEKTRALLNRQFPGRPVFTCQHKPVNVRAGLGDVIGLVKRIQNCSAVAFAGIAHPTGFFRSLLNAGVQLKSCFAFPDHCRYEPADLTQLLRSTREFGANLLITTEKDIVRLPADVQPAIAAMSVELDFGADERQLREYLRASLPV